MTAAVQTASLRTDLRGFAQARPQLRLVEETVVLPTPIWAQETVGLRVLPPVPEQMAPGRAARGLVGALKMVVDVTVALLLLLLIAPVLLAVAVAVRSDGGPVFFRQTRVGRDGREFRMVKFRSMVVDAEGRRAPLEAVHDGAGPLFKMRHDPRITRVGVLLRRYSLDELPQLFNVVSGSMSLIGPRPPLPTEVATYTAEERRRLAVRPGMTGLWQVSGRSDLSWAESIALDLQYVDAWTPRLEAQIVLRTASAVLGGRGAY